MSARRTPSTTSLSKYTKWQANEEDLVDRSLDFCNAFWGIADGGYEVLLTRLRGAARTTEELRLFWKERAAIENDYAKRLAKLAKQPFGRDEIGELRTAIDALRRETDRQSASHAKLAQRMGSELEQPVVERLNRHAQFKRLSQASIEKSYRAKQTQEQYVKKARQKYEDDCVRINSYTAQSTLVQGKELEKIQLRLEKARQTVQANEREFSQFARALADTTSRWEKEWKVFCDACQDIEEDRIEFMKDNMWAYANAVSTVCVTDDESCEMIRVALEQVEAEKDVENFVRDYGTGPQIPDPPAFVDYNSSASQQQQRLSWRTANFPRSSHRAVGIPILPPAAADDDITSPGNAGIGAGGSRSDAGTTSRPNSVAAIRGGPSAPNGTSSGDVRLPSHPVQQALPSTVSNGPAASYQSPLKQPSSNAVSNTVPRQATAKAAPQPASGSSSSQTIRLPKPQDPTAEPIDPRAQTMLKVGTNAYPVNPSEDPQRDNDSHESINPNVGAQDDPLARQIEELRVASNGGVRRGPSVNAPVRGGTVDSFQSTKVTAVVAPTSNFNGPPARSPSPNPPTAAYMIPPSNRSVSPLPTESVVEQYQQHFPGERRSLSISRQNSTNQGHEPASQGFSPSASAIRPVSPAREGHVGIGAHGGSRSPSPQPVSRGASPAIPHQQHQQRRLSYTSAAPPLGLNRATSPLGIDIDSSGRVAHDELAQRMYGQDPSQRRTSYYNGQGPAPGAPSQPRYDYTAGPPQVNHYAPGPQQRQYPQQVAQQQQPLALANSQATSAYSQPHRQNTTTSLYNPHPPAQPQPGRQPYNPTYTANTPYSVPPPAPPAQPSPPGQPGYGHPEQPRMQSRPSYSGYSPQESVSSKDYPSDGRSNVYGRQQGYQSSSTANVNSGANIHRPPSPAPQPPTGQYTESGDPVLFYVKALYDYHATIDEEFDFQADDIIAVTATPEDGWWNGELLDEMRRVPGKTIFPSNFVSLF